MRLSLFLIFAVTLLGCSQKPEIPSLPGGRTPELSGIVLRDEIHAKDIRDLIHALNRKGKLNGLVSVLDRTPDNELNTLGGVITRELYNVAFVPNALPDLVSQRVAQGGFAQWKSFALAWTSEPDYATEGHALSAILASPNFPGLLRRDIGFLAPDFTDTLKGAFSQAASLVENEPIPMGVSSQPLFAQALSRDLQNILFAKPDTLTNLGREWEDGPGASVFETLSQLPRETVEGFATGLAVRLPAPGDPHAKNRAEALLHLVTVLNEPSRGIFSDTAEILTHPDATVNALALKLEGAVQRTIADYIQQFVDNPDTDGAKFTLNDWLKLPRKTPDAPPTDQFVDLFNRIGNATHVIANASTEAASKPFLYDLPFTLHALALTEWLEHFVETHHDEIQKLDPAGYPKNFWNLAIQPKNEKSWDLALIGRVQIPDPHDATKKIEAWKLTARIQADLDAAGRGDDFAPKLERALTSPDLFANSSYKFFLDPTDNTLASALISQIARCEEVKPFSDPVPLSLSLLRTLGERLSSLETGDKETMAVAIAGGLSGVSTETYRIFETLFFKELGFANYEGLKDTLVKLYANHPDTGKRIDAILSALPALYDWDQASGTEPPPLELLLAALRGLGRDHVKPIVDLLAYLDQIHLVDFTSDGRTPYYPALYASLHDSRNLSRILLSLTFLDRFQRADLIEQVARSFGTDRALNSGIKAHLEVLQMLSRQYPDEITRVVSRFQSEGWDLFPSPDTLTTAERKWLDQFVQNGDAETLLRFLEEHSSREDLRSIAQELTKFSASGDLSDLLYLMSELRNDRMARLNQILKSWDLSHEFQAFSSTLEALFRG